MLDRRMCAHRAPARRTPTRRALAIAAALFTISGCATEIIDTTNTTVDSPVTTTTEFVLLADANLDQLAQVLRDETSSLSRSVFDGDTAAARTHLARIEQAWALAEPMIMSQYGEMADQITYDLRRVVALARSAIERNRPADASKALSFMRLALASLEAN